MDSSLVPPTEGVLDGAVGVMWGTATVSPIVRETLLHSASFQTLIQVGCSSRCAHTQTAMLTLLNSLAGTLAEVCVCHGLLVTVSAGQHCWRHYTSLVRRGE